MRPGCCGDALAWSPSSSPLGLTDLPMQPIFAELSSARALVPISSLGILAAKRETSFGLRTELLYVNIFVGALVQLTHPTFAILGQLRRPLRSPECQPRQSPDTARPIREARAYLLGPGGGTAMIFAFSESLPPPSQKAPFPSPERAFWK
jgi:hypothetical protein